MNKKYLIVTLTLILFLSFTSFSQNGVTVLNKLEMNFDFEIEFDDFELTDNEDDGEYDMDELLELYPDAASEIRSIYRSTVHSVRNFAPARDIISFSNFGLDNRSGRVVTYSEIVSIPEFQAESRTFILSKTDWAHCFAMAYLTKQFFEKATFSQSSSFNNDTQKKIEKVAQKKSQTLYGRDLYEFSNRNVKAMKNVLVPLQQKLFFSFSSIGYLFNQNQKSAFKNIRKEIVNNRLALVGIKKSLTWQHIVLAYKVEEDSNRAKIYIYDSNYPVRTTYGDVYLIYDKNAKKFVSNSYGEVTGFYVER